jgi:hypothetical protein
LALFTYRCLRCGKQHTDDRPFTEPFDVRCLRCGQSLTVTQQMVHVLPDREGPASQSQAITGQPAARGGNGTVKSGAADTQLMRREAITTLTPAVQRAELVEEPTESAPPEEEHEEESTQAEEPIAPNRPAPRPAAGPSLKEKPGPALSPAEEAERAARKKKTMVLATSIGVPVLLVCALGAFFIFNRGPKKVVAKKTTPKKKEQPKKAPPPPPKKEEPKKAPPPPPQVADFRFSAPGLAAELADDAKAANERYRDRVLEVSGILDRITGGAAAAAGPAVPAKGPKTPPPPAQAFFRTERAPVLCDMATLTGDAYRRQALQPGQPFTIRGTYRKDGLLENCLLLDPVAFADAKFAGKKIELIGTVDTVGQFQQQGEAFPSITLEGETNSTLVIRCVFSKAALDEVQRVQRGAVVGIRGTCSGRWFNQKQYEVRLDNCQLVETTARESSLERILVGLGRILATDLARAYEEDLRPYYLPPRGKEFKVETPFTVSDLSNAWKADRNSLERFRLKIITVTAAATRRQPPNRLVLEPAETDQPLRVACLFTGRTYARLGAGPAFSVTGLCMGMEKDGVLRLDNCEVDPSQLRWEGPTLTADFFPHKEGTIQVYDQAVYPPAAKIAGAVRQIWYQRGNGITETVTTHTLKGAPPSGSLFTMAKEQNWLKQPFAKKSKLNLPGTRYVQRMTVGFLEVGQRLPAPGRGIVMVFEPVLKLEAKPGDTWKWNLQNDEHTYTLVGFEKHGNRRSAIVQEVIVNTVTQVNSREIRHVYVEGIGEIERREWLVITSKDKKLVAEKKMIQEEQLNVGPPRPN